MSEENNNIKTLSSGTGKTKPLSPQENFESLTADELMERLCEVSCDSFYRNYALTLIEPVLHVAKALDLPLDWIHASLTREGLIVDAISTLTEAIEQNPKLKLDLLSEKLLSSIDKCQEFANTIEFDSEVHAGVGATINRLLINAFPVTESYSLNLSEDQLEAERFQAYRVFLPTKASAEESQALFASPIADHANSPRGLRGLLDKFARSSK